MKRKLVNYALIIRCAVTVLMLMFRQHRALGRRRVSAVLQVGLHISVKKTFRERKISVTNSDVELRVVNLVTW